MAEIIRCGKDPSYFCINYARISHPQRGLIPFNLYDFQKDVLLDFSKHRFNVILKARQLGISTTVAAYVCWLLLFHRDKNVLVVATKLQTATNLVKKIKAIHKNLPNWLKIASISIDNRTSFELTNGSQVLSLMAWRNCGQAYTLRYLPVVDV